MLPFTAAIIYLLLTTVVAQLFPTRDDFDGLEAANTQADFAGLDTGNAELVPQISSVSQPFRLGWSYDSVRNVQLPRCIVTNVILNDTSAGSSAVTEVRKDVTAKEAGVLLSLDVSVTGRYAIFSVTAGAGFSTNLISSDQSLTFVFSSTVRVHSNTLDMGRLDPEDDASFTAFGKEAKKSNDWNTICGDSFVSEEQYGGKLIVSLRVDFASKDDTVGFKAQLGLGVAILEIGIQLEAYIQRIRRNIRVKLSIHQVGGNPTALAQAVNAKSFSECDAVDVEAIKRCLALMTTAIDYARNTFSTDVADYPALIGFRTTEYSILGFSSPAREIGIELGKARDTVEKEIDRSIETIAKIDNFIDAGFVKPGRIKAFQKWRSFLMQNNIAILGSALDLCFNNLIITSKDSTANCIKFVGVINTNNTLQYPLPFLFDSVVEASITDLAIQINNSSTSARDTLKKPGEPIDDVREIPGTYYGPGSSPDKPELRAYMRRFEGGIVFFSHPIGASYIAEGPILTRYLSAIIAPPSTSPADSYNMVIGFPVGKITQYKSKVQQMLFENPLAMAPQAAASNASTEPSERLAAQGAIVWKEGPTAILLSDICTQQYRTYNLDSDPQDGILGFPLTETEEAYDGQSGKFCLFEKGLVYYQDVSSRTAEARAAIEARVVHGDNYRFWKTQRLAQPPRGQTATSSGSAQFPLFASLVGQPLSSTTEWTSKEGIPLGHLTYFTRGVIFSYRGAKYAGSFSARFDVAASQNECILNAAQPRYDVISKVVVSESTENVTLQFTDSNCEIIITSTVEIK